MGNYFVAVMLVFGWVLGVAVFGAGAGIHALLFVAMISVAGGQTKQRKLHRSQGKYS